MLPRKPRVYARAWGGTPAEYPLEKPVQDVTSPRGYAAREVGFKECQVDPLRDHCPARSDKAGLVLTQMAKFNKGSLSSFLGYTCPTERRDAGGGGGVALLPVGVSGIYR